MKILIIDEMHESIEPLLQKHHLKYDYLPKIAPAEVEKIISQYEGLILRSKMRLTMDFIQKAQQLKFIARAGAGVDEIDEKALEKLNITLLNAPEGNRDAVGEHTVGMILCLLNKMHTADREVRQKLWQREKNRGYELGNMVVGIIGYGNMGKATAKRLSSFGCEVITYDKHKINYGDQYARQVTQEEIFERCNLVSFHIPLNDENKYLADVEYFKKFKNPIWLFNLARGEVIPLAAIRWGLENGKILGAGLDVLENEKLATMTQKQQQDFEYLANSDKVLFTPHVGGWTFESYHRINVVLVDKIVNLLNNNE
ncbi:MAG: 2-hydroxyacid dehydrogenase [Flammeovirgaceae bacterium]